MAQIIVAQRMWQRNDTAANWTSVNPTLANGEIGVERGATSSDPSKVKIGNGVTPWATLPYFGGSGGGGAAWYTGSGAPSGGTGVDGDMYLRTSNGDYYKKIAGTWTLQGNLTGPAGATGATGAAGPAGPPGADSTVPGPVGPAVRFSLQFCDSTQSTKFDGSNKLTVGRKYFDPAEVGWSLQPTSTATLFMILETTNATFTAEGDVHKETGGGSPLVIGAVGPVAGTTATLVSADVSAHFVDTAPAGIFAARVWLTTADGTQMCTCSGAWIEVQP